MISTIYDNLGIQYWRVPPRSYAWALHLANDVRSGPWAWQVPNRYGYRPNLIPYPIVPSNVQPIGATIQILSAKPNLSFNYPWLPGSVA